MQNLRLNRATISHAFWRTIFESGIWIIKELESHHLSKYIPTEYLRNSADYNTGSISFATTISLGLATAYFKPSTVIEIGTFIGRSTAAVAQANYLSSFKKCTIHSCDASNDIALDLSDFCDLTQYGKTKSTSMLKQLQDKQFVADMVVIDGRLEEQDAILIKEVMGKRSVIFLDDFEGVEKGVANADLLFKHRPQSFTLVYPPSTELLSEFSLQGSSGLAALLPTGMIELTKQ